LSSIRTFLDAGVLISAFRGIGPIALAAQSVVDEPGREFVVSDVLRLELIPKPYYSGRPTEAQFYEEYFAAAAAIIETTPALVKAAEVEAKRYGLSAADALHLVAAREAAANEFITTERATKPLFRFRGLKLVTLHVGS
jgi:predicted nucleic acid-binding protein